MPEYRHLRVGPAFLYERGNEREVIVLHQDDRPFDATYLVEQRFRKQCVDFAILSPILFAELRADVRHVTERPQGFVGESIVVAASLLLGKPHALERVSRLVVRDTHLAFGVGSVPVGWP